MKPGTAAALCGKINLGDVLESVAGSVSPSPSRSHSFESPRLLWRVSSDECVLTAESGLMSRQTGSAAQLQEAMKGEQGTFVKISIFNPSERPGTQPQMLELVRGDAGMPSLCDGRVRAALIGGR